MMLNLRHVARRSILVLAASTAIAQACFAQTGDKNLDLALAERFASVAEDSALGNLPEPILRQSAALLDLSLKLNPNELRYLRSSADVLMQVGDLDRAIQALNTIRRLDPQDQLAMVQLVDLQLGKMESADQKLTYLRQVVGAPSVAAEVRSHAAFQGYQLLVDRGQDSQAIAMLEQCLELNPQNVSALRIRYQQALATGDTEKRISALIGVIEASPAEAEALISMAQEASAVGAQAQAGMLYNIGFAALVAQGQQPSLNDYIDFANSTMVGGNYVTAMEIAKMLIHADERQPELYTLHALARDARGDAFDDLRDDMLAARDVWLTMLATYNQGLNRPDDKDLPTTRPAPPMPDVLSDAKKLRRDGPAALMEPYALAIADLIWFDVYFGADRINAEHVEAVSLLLGPEHPIAVRSEGIRLLAAGSLEEARVKLSAVGDRDVIAALALARADLANDATRDQGMATIQSLVNQLPAGIEGAYVASVASRNKLKPIISDDAKPVVDAAEQAVDVARKFFQQPRELYLLSAEAKRVSYDFGEPMLVDVTIKNVSKKPITLGPSGMIKPMIVVDASVRNAQTQMVPVVAAAKLHGRIRLAPKQTMTQTVRVDRGPLAPVLRLNPLPPITMNFQVTSNPVPSQQGARPSPGGMQTLVGSVIERRASPVQVESFRNQILERLKSSDAATRMQTAEFVAIASELLMNPNNTNEANEAGRLLREAMKAQAEIETQPVVRTWMSVLTLPSLAEPADQMALLKSQLESKDELAQVLCLLMARAMPDAERKELAKMVQDGGATGPLAELAAGMLSMPDAPPPSDAEKPAESR
jgi:tetratricopeptide (TPR) repeat protein